MAKKQLSQADLQKALDRINAIYGEFKIELARLKAERLKIIDRINRKTDDKKIQEILKNIK